MKQRERESFPLLRTKTCRNFLLLRDQIYGHIITIQEKYVEGILFDLIEI